MFILPASVSTGVEAKANRLSCGCGLVETDAGLRSEVDDDVFVVRGVGKVRRGWDGRD